MQNTSKYSFAMGVVIAIAMSITANAQTAKSGTAPVKPVATGDDKVDISDLESKYWAPKDTDFSVVQNRTYSKDKKFMIAPQYGGPINDAFSDGYVFGATGNYFLSERMGLQASYLLGEYNNNQTTRDLGALSGSGGAVPNHGKFSSYMGVGLNIVPFYAKMSFWGKRIIYFDMAFTPTIGMTGYKQQLETGAKEESAFTYGLDVTQYFFFSRSFAIRVDLKNNFYKQEILRYRGAGVIGTKVEDKNIQDTMYLLGAAFYF